MWQNSYLLWIGSACAIVSGVVLAGWIVIGVVLAWINKQGSQADELDKQEQVQK